MEWVQPFKRDCEKLGIAPGAKILVAVSGGMDSMCLLHLCVSAGYEVGVAHANFQLRGTESADDAQFVAERCRHYGVPCHIEVLHVNAGPGTNVQATARALRYQWFEQLASAHGYHHIVTAHHLHDKLETFFIHLLRGSGVKGLASIPAVRGRVARPLLGKGRPELEAFAKAAQLTWREDRTNQSDAYLRNRIRHHLVPAFLGLSPKALEGAAGSMAHLAAADGHLSKEADAFALQHIRQLGHDLYRIEVEAIEALAAQPTLAHYVLAQWGFEAPLVPRVLSLLTLPSGRQVQGPEWHVYRDRHHLVFAPAKREEWKPAFLTEKTGRWQGPITVHWHALAEGASAPDPDRKTALLTYERLEFPLTLRPWQPGDRFVPSGMRGSKKLSDFLTDLKLSVPEKDRVWVLCSGADICWVVGCRVDERYRWKGEGEKVVMSLGADEG